MLSRIQNCVAALRAEVLTADELAQRFDVSSKTIYRDIEFLGGLGLEIVRTRQGFRLKVNAGICPLCRQTIKGRACVKENIPEQFKSRHGAYYPNGKRALAGPDIWDD